MIVKFCDNGKILSNKGMGWVTHVYCGEEKDYNEVESRPFVDNVALLYTWAQIETQEGVFDFSKVDEKVAKHTALGQCVHFRISTDPMIYQGANGVPDYVFTKYKVKYFERNDYGCVARFPDYLDENYQMCLTRFLTAFKNHYKNNPYVLQVDLRGYGEWGEWHSGYMHETRQLHNQALNKIIQIWSSCFADTDVGLALSSSYEWRSDLPLQLHAPKSYEEYKYFQGFDNLQKYPNITFRRDGIGGALRVYDKQIIDDYYFSQKRHGITAEFFGGYLRHKEMPDGIRGYHVEDAVEEALCIHPNYMMFMWDSNQFYNERQDLVQDVSKRIGFRLIPQQTEIVASGNKVNVCQTWVNKGVGKYPFRSQIVWKIVADGTSQEIVDDGFDASAMRKDETLTHTVSLPNLSPTQQLYFKLQSQKGDAVHLPIDCPVVDGFYKLT
ncbi:MAG: hypothetical protein ACI4QH_05195 [Candidatus Fimimonas sp.]